MSRRLTYVAGACALVLITVLAVVPASRSAPAREGVAGGDVVMIRCDVGASGFLVKAYTGSSSAPSRKTDNCAEAISLLHRDGFTVEHVATVDDDDGYLVYLLSR